MEAWHMSAHVTFAATAGTRALALDPALPGRDDLLDPVLVAEILTGSLGGLSLEVSEAELTRVKYRIGESLRVLYTVSAAGRRHLVTGRMFTGGLGVAAFAKAARHPGPTGGSRELRPAAYDGARDTVWWSFPHDRRLVGLADVLDPVQLPSGLRAGLGGNVGDDIGGRGAHNIGGTASGSAGGHIDTGVGVGQWSASSVVQYAPERSATFRALDPAGEILAFVKCYAPATQDVAQLAARYDFFAARLRTADPALRSPRALAHDVDRNLLLLEPMPGRSWLDLDRASAVEALRGLGRAIAVLHATPLGGGITSGLRRFGRLDLRHVVRAGELISQALPDVAAAAGSLTDRLASGPPVPQEPVLLHGDCHPGNVLVAGDRVSVLDIDQAGTGPAAADIGSLLARLAYGATLGESDQATATLMSNAFLDGYTQVRALPDAQTLAWYAAAAMLAERGLRAVNRIRTEALGQMPGLLGSGHDLLDGRWRR
jgi:Ser/Thr protein kinase RdoA (MazF antagonist)